MLMSSRSELDGHEHMAKEAHLLDVSCNATLEGAREVEQELELQREGDVEHF